jgi:fucose 4-O-acetylase-like acetyltransferase
MENTGKKPRLEWLDALRGFTMILVVAFHVAMIGFGEQSKLSSSMRFLVLFRMPLFFFVSGFLAYKAGLVWNGKTLGTLLAKKIRVQTVPTVVFFFLGVAILGGYFWPTTMRWLYSPTKGGYWFTIVLLYMFIVYYLFCFVEERLKKWFPKMPSWLPIAILFVISLCCYDTCYQPRYFSWAAGYKGAPNDFMIYSSFGQLFLYFPFFLYGNMVRRYWEQAQRIMDAKWFFPILFCVALYAWLDSQKWHWLRMAWATLPLTLARFTLLTIVFMYFRYYQQYFTQRTVIGASLQYIGRRTLDIYLIHYLFMPNLPTIGNYFNQYRHNFAIDTTLSILIALVVIAFSIIASNILRVSPFFKKWLFGRG